MGHNPRHGRRGLHERHARQLGEGKGEKRERKKEEEERDRKEKKERRKKEERRRKRKKEERKTKNIEERRRKKKKDEERRIAFTLPSCCFSFFSVYLDAALAALTGDGGEDGARARGQHLLHGRQLLPRQRHAARKPNTPCKRQTALPQIRRKEKKRKR